uniref:cAMP-dependent protein kinase type II regulatory subunit n=1 Tax=Macrostomum lignano TaxID=282301 RepID=A0A1I8ISG1_9PLAT
PAMSFEIPAGLPQLLQDFTVAVLRSRPGNLVTFASAYFRQLEAAAAAKPPDGAAATSRTAEAASANNSDADDEDAVDSAWSGVSGAGGGGAPGPAGVAAPSFDPELHHEDEGQRKLVPKSDEQRRRLAEAVKHILLFRSLDRASLGHVIDAMQEAPVRAGETVIQQHQDGDNFYVVERGVFDAFVDDKNAEGGRRHVLTYNNEGSFGELALMYYCPRAATIVARTDGVLWSLDMETFQRRKYEAFLAAVPLLAELTQYERQNVADAIREREFSDGAPILMQGDVGNEMFFIEEGGVKVMRRGADNGLETQVNQLGKGDYFGELALITKQPRAASCYAVGPTKVCVLHVTDFERLLGPCLEVMRRNIEDYRRQLGDIFGHEDNVPQPRLQQQQQQQVAQ